MDDLTPGEALLVTPIEVSGLAPPPPVPARSSSPGALPPPPPVVARDVHPPPPSPAPLPRSTAVPSPSRENAASERATAAWLVSTGRRAWGTLVVGLVLLAAFGWATTTIESRTAWLDKHGVHVGGAVAHYEAGSGGDGGTASRVTVQFTYRGAVRQTTVTLDDSSPSYRRGERVTVLVDPTDSSHVSLPGVDNQPGWQVALMISALLAGLLSVGSGIVAVTRRSRIRRALLAGPWRSGELFLLSKPARPGSMLVAPGDGYSYGFVCVVPRSVSSRPGPGLVQWAGRLDGEVVVRPSGQTEPGRFAVLVSRPHVDRSGSR